LKKFYFIVVALFSLQFSAFAQTTVTNLNAFYRDGQVFVTWDNLSTTGVRYNLYKSSTPIQNGAQLLNAENLGAVRDNSARNLRLTGIFGIRYFKIDSSGTPLNSTQGLFVTTSTEQGSFYYAVTTIINNTEDTTIQFGTNSLQTSITEMIEMPRPVWQETATVTGKTFDIYTQFVSKITSDIYPQMTNEGSYAFHFAICKQGFGLNHSITFYMRPSGNNFLQYAWGIDDPNDWIVTIDDWIPSGQQLATLYYGNHENFDMFIYPNPIPTTGTIYNYTAARVNHTIDWCLDNLPVDTTRVYMTGWSMGGIGVMLNMTTVAEKIAAVYVLAPIFNMSISTVATYANQLWGTAGTNLLTNEGYTRNQRLNSCCMVSEKRNTSLPIMFTFCGKNDGNVGWSEKVIFYDSVNTNNHGAFHFWSYTDHFNVLTPWSPSYSNFSFFTRYRTNLSYPAFSNCSLDDNPGNGDPTTGDSIGTINGYLDWNDNIVDSLERWEITLYVKDLSTSQGTLVAPDSGTTDVTLRRLQNFSAAPVETIYWENQHNGSIVQEGSLSYNGSLITISEVKVYKDSSHLKVFLSPVNVDKRLDLPKQFVLSQNYPNPFNPSTKISWQLPQAANVTIKIFNALGEEVATLVDNEYQNVGTHSSLFIINSSLTSGVYFYQLKAGEYVNTKKMILLK
jgi:hypothetical protein